MKKILFGLLLVFAVSTKSSAQTDTTGTRYWYYPSQNFYYNDVSGDYWYWDQPTSKWVDVKQLPSTYKMTEADERYVIYYKGKDRNIWNDNKDHKIKYKLKGDKKPVPPQQ